MPPPRPMLDDLELVQAQRIASSDEQVFAEHAVPSLEGDFLQDLGRRAVRIEASAVLSGPEAKDKVADLREKILAYIAYYNRTRAKPYKWTYTGRPLNA